MFLKIINLIDKYGTADYKGINLDFVIPNTQIYNFEQNFCYLETDENIIKDKEDIFIITEEEYIKYKQQHDEDIKENQKDISQNTDLEKEQLIKTVNNLSVENQKKDFMLKELASTVNTLNLQIQKLEGGSI